MTKKLRLLLTIILTCLIAMTTAMCFVVSAESYNGATISVAPEITISYSEGCSADNIPNAVKDKEYKIFDASAKDVYGNAVAVKTKVYAHYDSENKSLIGFNNGVVVVKSYGIYTVEYSAKDVDGNTSVLVYDFVCVEKSPLSLVIDESSTEQIKAGQTIILDDYQIYNAIGNIELSITANHLETGKTYSIDSKSRVFTPMNSGDYTIKYVCKDYNETVMKEFSLSVEDNDTPIFFETPKLNDYYIVGYEYQLPIVKCYHFASGSPISVEPEISVQIGYNKPKKLLRGLFKPDANGSTVITYSATYDGQTVSKDYIVQSVEVGYGAKLDMGSFFFATEGSVKTNVLSKGVQLTTPINGTKVDFINTVACARLELNYGINPESNFGRLDIYLTDSVDKDVCVKFSVIKGDGEKAFFIVNDLAADKYASEIDFSKLETIKANYNEKTKTFSMGGSYTMTITNTLLGDRFNGFPSGSCKISFGFEELVESSSVTIYKINNQALSKATKDSIEPQVVFYLFDKGIMQIGEIVTIDRVYVSDVLSPECEVSYSVSSPNGEFVIAMDGTVLDGNGVDYTKEYSFTVNQTGAYLVTISVKDSAYAKQNSEVYSYAINVRDLVAPTIYLGATGDLSVKLGKSVTLRKPFFYDDISINIETGIFVIRPDGVVDYISNGKVLKYKPVMKGEHNDFYYAKDEAENVSTINYKFTVK